MTVPKTLAFNDGASIPRIGLGVWRVSDAEAPHLVTQAIEAGYRHIDTAQGYDNEAGVGRAITQTDLPRDELFVTSKLRVSQQGRDSTFKAFDESMEKLGIDTLDLFLIHWPAPAKGLYVETWKAFVELQGQGRIRSIGVSNFLPEHLERIVGETGVTPAANQIELHPRYQQRAARDWHEQHGIVTESYSPLGGNGAELLKDEVITTIAGRLGKSPAQVVIRWHLQLGLVVLPKSGNVQRATENLSVWDFELSAADMSAIGALDDPDGKILSQPNEMNS